MGIYEKNLPYESWDLKTGGDWRSNSDPCEKTHPNPSFVEGPVILRVGSLGYMSWMNYDPLMWRLFHKPSHKDLVLKQPAIHWKLMFLAG